jgi:TctA family transporter
MDEIQALMHGFAVALTPTNLALMFTGVVLGVIIGVLPGLGGANGVAILLPLTFGMAQTPGGATSAIILLSCIYWGALFGGAITSVLFNIPGEPWSVATTFDGYPLAKGGNGDLAISLATLGFLVAMLVGIPLYEEVAFRGFLFPQLYLKLGGAYRARLWVAAIISALLFALMHLPNRMLVREMAGTAPGGRLPLPNATTTAPSCLAQAQSSMPPSSPKNPNAGER